MRVKVDCIYEGKWRKGLEIRNEKQRGQLS